MHTEDTSGKFYFYSMTLTEKSVTNFRTGINQLANNEYDNMYKNVFDRYNLKQR